MSVQITICKPLHYAGIAAVYNESIEKGSATMDEIPFTATDIQQWVSAFSERERLFVLLKEDEVIGWSIIKQYHPRPGYRTAGETSVYLTEKVIGQGYGRQMLEHLLAVCKELGYHHLVAKIWADNTASIKFHEKLGYEIVGTQREVGRKHGRWIDVTIMQYVFAE